MENLEPKDIMDRIKKHYNVSDEQIKTNFLLGKFLNRIEQFVGMGCVSINDDDRRIVLEIKCPIVDKRQSNAYTYNANNFFKVSIEGFLIHGEQFIIDDTITDGFKKTLQYTDFSENYGYVFSVQNSYDVVKKTVISRINIDNDGNIDRHSSFSTETNNYTNLGENYRNQICSLEEDSVGKELKYDNYYSFPHNYKFDTLKILASKKLYDVVEIRRRLDEFWKVIYTHSDNNIGTKEESLCLVDCQHGFQDISTNFVTKPLDTFPKEMLPDYIERGIENTPYPDLKASYQERYNKYLEGLANNSGKRM